VATKRNRLTPTEQKKIREIAKAEALRIVTEGSRFGASPFLLSPVTRPFAAPIARGIPQAANILLKSGALDPFINAKINELVAQRGILVEDMEGKSRQELLFDLAEAGVDILSDPEIQKELKLLDQAQQKEGDLFPSSIRKQFSRANIVGGINLETPKRSRKKTKTDKNMSKALEEANSKLRTQKGKLRKGKTQADVMRLAHRLRKKMS